MAGSKAIKKTAGKKEAKTVKEIITFQGEFEGVRVYGHKSKEPLKLKAGIQAARKLHPHKKLWAVFQPHSYSSLHLLFSELQKTLVGADKIVISDVFSLRAQTITTPTGKDLARAIGMPKATYVGGDLTNMANFLKRNTTKGETILLLGHGDIHKVSELLLSA